MPKGRQWKGRKRRDAEIEKKRERSVRQALRRERKVGAYLSPGNPDFQSFSDQLAVQGLRLQDVPGDGNCLFRALADQLGNRTVTHSSLRRDIVRHMRENRTDFEPFVDEGSFEDYLLDLSKEGVYAGNDAIVAFSRVFHTHVIIHQLDTPRWEITAPPASATPTSATPTLHIAYLNGEHYCSVRRLGPSPRPPLKIRTIPQLELKPLERDNPKEDKEATELDKVITATGCKNLALAGAVLMENCYQSEMAIVELLQLMALEEEEEEEEEEMVVVRKKQEEEEGGGQKEAKSTVTSPPSPSSPSSCPSPPSASPCPSPSPPSPSLCPAHVLPLTRGGGLSLASQENKSSSKTPIKPQRHLSNRERKAQAKASRKERRLKEQRASKITTKNDATTLDPVGVTTI